MKSILSGLCLVGMGILFAQNTVEIQPNENLTIELDSELAKVLEPLKDTIAPPPPPPSRTSNEFCRGARLQIFYSKNAQEADKKLKEFQKLYQGMRGKVEYISPEYKVRVGYFQSREEAEPSLRKIKSQFPLALIVDEKFRCNLIQK